MNITDAEIAMLEGCRSAEEWNTMCKGIKSVRGGQYPPDWWPKVKLSGLMDRVTARWGGDAEIRIQAGAAPSEDDGS